MGGILETRYSPLSSSALTPGLHPSPSPRRRLGQRDRGPGAGPLGYCWALFIPAVSERTHGPVISRVVLEAGTE